MYTRFYVLTISPIVNQEFYYYKDGYYSHGQHLERLRARDQRWVTTDLDYRTRAVTAATHQLLAYRVTVGVFAEWKEADKTAKRYKSQYKSRIGGDVSLDCDFTHYKKEFRRPAVLEVYVDNEKAPELKSGSLSMNPAHCFVKQASFKGSSIALRSNPESYAILFQKNNTNPVTQVAALFRDYYSPKLFSFHWRHHKQQARDIVTNLKIKNTQEAFDYLFKQRQEFLLSNAGKSDGSFMRRIEAALSLLIDNGAVPTVKSVKSQTMPSL
jgi:hypothetical protein